MLAYSLFFLCSGAWAISPKTENVRGSAASKIITPKLHKLKQQQRSLEDFGVRAVQSDEVIKPSFNEDDFQSTPIDFTPAKKQEIPKFLVPPEESNLASSNIVTRFGGVKFPQSGSIPPDPMGAAGPVSVVQVVNVNIECRTREGTLLWSTRLVDFFSDLGATRGFDPKIVFDEHENRFVVVALDLNRNARLSTLLLAVSKTDAPSTVNDWYFTGINSSIEGTWADYPGFEVDEEAIYITANMFFFSGGFDRALLWIVGKDQFYNGQGAVVKVTDFPTNSFGTHQPAAIRSGVGAGAGIGTYFVTYGFFGIELTATGEHVLIVNRIDRPLLDSVSFTTDIIPLGIFEGGQFVLDGSLPLAPQPGFFGEPVGIMTNDRRVLDAAWHDGYLWATLTLNQQGVSKAVWFRMDTRSVETDGDPGGLLLLDDFSVISGDDIGPSTTTFFPSVAVNSNGVAAIGFSASSLSVYPGAYATWRTLDPNFIPASQVVMAGMSPYVRTFGGDRNRWGDYTGAAVDPLDENCFWLNNQYADVPCDVDSTTLEFGCWNTAWARLCVGGEAAGVDADAKKKKKARKKGEKNKNHT